MQPVQHNYFEEGILMKNATETFNSMKTFFLMNIIFKKLAISKINS